MSNAECAVDLKHLDRYTGGDRALNIEILRLFESQCLQMLVNLETICEGGDTKAWREITHTLKGAARGVGAFPLADVAAEAEPLQPDAETTLQVVDRLKEKSAAVQRFIEEFLATPGAD